MPDIQLTKGQALVLTGPQGCGKTRIAEEIACKAGAYQHVEAGQLANGRYLNNVLANEYNTLIVEGLPKRAETIFELVEMLACDTVAIKTPYKRMHQVKTPNFIFCSGDKDALKLIKGSRRFRVVTVGDRS